ncbi:MAG: hypothetical protein E7Y34_00710 [Mycoplasma sp.]|nr:hypothetical protein [Mycoplasma sp.]
MTKKIIEIGFTNISYIENNQFVQEKKYFNFNHNIDYSILKTFSFVPKLLHNDKHKLIWEYIEGESPFTPNKDDLKTIVNIFLTIHQSNLDFPPNNIKDRALYYLSKININVKEAHNYKFLLDWLDYKNQVPCHIDPFIFNFIKTKSNNIYLVDWEYATMGDLHFDLAYFIEGLSLNEEDELVLLNEYRKKQKINFQQLKRMKYFVHWLVILWANAQEKIPFPLDVHINYLKDLKK